MTLFSPIMKENIKNKSPAHKENVSSYTAKSCPSTNLKTGFHCRGGRLVYKAWGGGLQYTRISQPLEQYGEASRECTSMRIWAKAVAALHLMGFNTSPSCLSVHEVDLLSSVCISVSLVLLHFHPRINIRLTTEVGILCTFGNKISCESGGCGVVWFFSST